MVDQAGCLSVLIDMLTYSYWLKLYKYYSVQQQPLHSRVHILSPPKFIPDFIVTLTVNAETSSPLTVNAETSSPQT